MRVYLCLGPGQLSITDARAGHVAHGVCNVQYGPHYAPAVTRHYPPCVPGPCPAHCDALNTFWVVRPGPGARREVSNFIIFPGDICC